MNLVFYTDGGSRGNPGPAAYGFVVQKGNEIIYGEGAPIGIETNNVAEYTAFIQAITWIASNRETIGDYEGIEARLDSLLVCQQLAGKYKITKPHLKDLYDKAWEVIRSLNTHIEFVHVLRDKNKTADSLVNRALDTERLVSLE